MDKQEAYRLVLMAIDQGKVSPVEIVDWLYDNGYEIHSMCIGADAKVQKEVAAAWEKSRKEWGGKP